MSVHSKKRSKRDYICKRSGEKNKEREVNCGRQDDEVEAEEDATNGLHRLTAGEEGTLRQDMTESVPLMPYGTAL